MYFTFMKFNSFEDIKKHFIEPDIFNMLDLIMKKQANKELLIEQNQNQLKIGLDANNKVIKTLRSVGSNVYSLYTISIKRKLGQDVRHVTLADTGKFYKSFKVKILEQGYEITANFQKTDGNIKDNFDNDYDFLGLNYESLFIFVNDIIYPELEKLIIKQYLND